MKRAWLGAASVAFFVSQCGLVSAADDLLRDACETVIRARLVLPDSYKPVSITPSTRIYALDDFANLMLAQGAPIEPSTLASLRQAGATPTRYSLSILYRAGSALGGDALGTAGCDFVSLTGAPIDAAGAQLVEVNGETMAQYAKRHVIAQ